MRHLVTPPGMPHISLGIEKDFFLPFKPSLEGDRAARIVLNSELRCSWAKTGCGARCGGAGTAVPATPKPVA